MLKHKILLADGSVLSSGAGTIDAIRSVTLTEQVNDGEDLCPGAACAACAEIELWAPENQLHIAQGTELTLLRVDTDTGTETPAGIFLAEKPTKASANVYKITAYDRMTLFDRDMTDWLSEQQAALPMTLTAFVERLCAACGVEPESETLENLPNGEFEIQAFSGDGLTGRKLLQWAAQAMGRFARMTGEGRLELAWYEQQQGKTVLAAPGTTTVGVALRLAGAVLRVANSRIWRMSAGTGYYLQNTLQYEDYETAPLDKVQIKQSENDVGGIWPPEETGDNALVISGNRLLVSDNADALRQVARGLYEVARKERYTPLRVTLPFAEEVRPGTRLDVFDSYGKVHRTLVMKRVIRGQVMELESTGNARRDGTSAVNQQSWESVTGQLLEIRTDMEGVKVTLSGKVDGEEAQTMIDQSLESLTLSAQEGDKASVLTLKAGATTLTSAKITFSGMVEFEDLSTPGHTTINGANLKTGTVLSTTGYTRLDLDNGVFQVGKDATDYVRLDPGGITWRGGADLDGATARGQIRTSNTRCYFTSDTRYQMIGWYHEQTGQFAGLEIEQVDNAGTFSNRLNVNGVLSCRTLLAWDAKERVVRTPYGNLGMHAMESPEPLFLDGGSAVIGQDGVCCLVPDPRYAATVSATVALRWYVCPTSPGQVWVEPTAYGALLHGEPGMTADWMCAGIQRGYEGVYADEQGEEKYPDGGYTEGLGLLDASFPQETDLPLDNEMTEEMEEKKP